MMYPFLTLIDNTEITHSEMKKDGSVKVYIETPDPKDFFHNAVCWLPDYRWEKVEGFTTVEIDELQELIQSLAHIIYELARDGGFEHAAVI